MNANWAGPFLETLARTSCQAGVLVVIILAAQWIFRRQLTPGLRCALWMLVMARLLLPVSLPTGFSIFNLLPSTPPVREAAETPPSVVPATTPAIVAAEPGRVVS